MKIAIIGAGLSGLGAAWHLLESGCAVTLFDAKGVGGGASGVSSGLLHPYPGEKGKRSWHATECLQWTQQLLDIASEAVGKSVILSKGILREALSEEQVQQFSLHGEYFRDVVQVEEKLFLITSGMTIHTTLYLEGLWQACEAKGAELIIQKIETLSELDSYDRILIAAGEGTLGFEECKQLPIKGIKGQLFTCQMPAHFSLPEYSRISKGYVAIGRMENCLEVGATYERSYTTSLPEPERALKELGSKIEQLCPDAAVIDCRSGVRVARKGHYLPLLKQLSDKCWVLTAMGSRGLLYHAYYGHQFAHVSLQEEALTV